MIVDDLLDDGTHTVTDIRYPTFADLLLYPGNLDILQIGHTRDAVLFLEVHQHGTVDGGEHDGTTQRCPDDSTLRK